MTSTWAARAEEARLGRGVIRYRDVGDGPVLVFVHGVLVNGELWREVVEILSGRYRCVVPDLPLGGHEEALAPGPEVGPSEVAGMLSEFMSVLDLEDVTLVGNDTGGAICQLVVAGWPGRVGGLVLTNCDAYESFFPWPLRIFQYGPRVFGERFTRWLAGVLRYRVSQRLLFRLVARRGVSDAVLDGYFRPLVGDPGVRRDLTGFLRRVSNRHTLEAARAFPRFQGPVLLVWGRDDPLFSARLARRLQRDFPRARLEYVAGSRAFVPVDQPRRLADRIEAFLRDKRDARL